MLKLLLSLSLSGTPGDRLDCLWMGWATALQVRIPRVRKDCSQSCLPPLPCDFRWSESVNGWARWMSLRVKLSKTLNLAPALISSVTLLWSFRCHHWLYLSFLYHLYCVPLGSPRRSTGQASSSLRDSHGRFISWGLELCQAEVTY